MRTFTILVAALLAAGALTGCIGNAAEKESDTENIDAQSVLDAATGATDAGAGAQAAAALTVLAPLTSTLKLDAAAWVAPGTSVPVSATPPTNAKGDVTYTWATGALPGTAAVTDLKLDTKTIAAGASSVLTFTTAGVYRMHCHPHPYMKHNVTVVDGLAPSEQTVQIVDGEKQADSRFVPESIVVGVGSKVTYVNKGKLAHTATTEAQEPSLTKAPLDKATGEIKLEGTGWQRVVVLMRDAEGRVGSAEQRIYVAPIPSFTDFSLPFKFGAGGAPEQAEGTVSPPITGSFNAELPLVANVTMTAKVAPGGTAVPDPAPNLAQVEVHIGLQSETQDSITCDAGSSCEQSGKLPKGIYKVTVIAKQGAQIEGTVLVTGAYELVPPEPTMPAAGGGHEHGGGGGGHAGH